MTPEHQHLSTNFNTFISKISNELDIRIALITSDGIAYNKENFCPKDDKPIELISGGCFVHNKSESTLNKLPAYLDPTNAKYIGDGGCYYEAPMYYGLYTFLENPTGCIRNNSKKIMFILTDEDERVGNEDKPIDSKLQNFFIEEFKKLGLSIYSVTHGLNRPIVGRGDHAPAIHNVVTSLGGEDFDINANYGTHLTKFADDINRFALEYTFTNTGNDDLATATVLLKEVNKENYVVLDPVNYSIKTESDNRFSVVIKNQSALSGYDKLKVIFPPKEKADFPVQLAIDNLNPEKLEVYINTKKLSKTHYRIDYDLPGIVINKDYPIGIGDNVKVRFVDFKN